MNRATLHVRRGALRFYRSYLVEFQANQTSNQSSCCDDGRDNLTGDQLGFETIDGLDAVSNRSQVGGGSDEVDVEVSVIILLEINLVESVLDLREKYYVKIKS